MEEFKIEDKAIFTLQDAILDILRENEKGRPITAKELAQILNVTKKEVNFILYRMENKTAMKTGTNPPYWKLIPLEDRIVRCLTLHPMTANAIAEKLHVATMNVVSVLYRLEGFVVYHDNNREPKWFLIDK